MLYKIRCNPLHPLYGAVPVLYVPVRVTRGAVIAHRYTYAPPSCRTLQYGKTFIPFSVSLWNGLSVPQFRWCCTGGFQEQGQCLFIGLAASSLFVSSCFPFLFFHSMGCYCDAGVFGLIGCLSLFPALRYQPFLIIIIIS